MNRLKRQRIACALLLIAVMGSQSVGFAQTVIDGFAPKPSDNQRRLEDQFRAVPSAANAREELRRLTAEAHLAGSPKIMRRQFTFAIKCAASGWLPTCESIRCCCRTRARPASSS